MSEKPAHPQHKEKVQSCVLIREKIAHSYSTGDVQSFMRLSSRKILYIALFSCKFFDKGDKNLQENKTKSTKNIEVRAIGKPSITALSESEQQVFYTTLLKRIVELATKGGEEQ